MIRDAHGRIVPATTPLKGWEAVFATVVVLAMAAVAIPFGLAVRK